MSTGYKHTKDKLLKKDKDKTISKNYLPAELLELDRKLVSHPSL
jgi:hypothetical protein